MAEFFSSGRVFYLVLAVIALELLSLLVQDMFSRNGRILLHMGNRGDVYANLLAAGGLLGAAQCVLAHIGWGWTALLLGVALTAHLAGLKLRRVRVSPRSGQLYNATPHNAGRAAAVTLMEAVDE